MGRLINRDLVSLPSWFPADKAAAVLRHRGKAFALISDRSGLSGVAEIRSLTAAPRDKSVMWSAVSLAEAIGPSTSIDVALELMDLHAVDCLPVVVAGLIVGIVSREALVGTRSDSSVVPVASAA